MKFWILLFAGTAIAAILWSIPILGLPPDEGLLNILAPEIAQSTPRPSSSLGLETHLIHYIYSVAGLPTAHWVRNALPLLKLLLAISAGIGFLFFLTRWKPSGRTFLTRAAALCLIFLLSFSLFHWITSNRNLSKKLQFIPALEEATSISSSGKIWANPTAARWLKVLQPALNLDFSQKSLEAGTNPPIWRELDRTHHFETVILAGSTSEYLPLLQHLIQSHDWQLRLINPYSIVFSRTTKSKQAAWLSLQQAAQEFPNPLDQAFYLSRIATNLAAMQKFGEAHRFFRRAIELTPNRPDIQSLYASFLAERKQWAEAIAEATMTLSKYPNYIPALQVLVQAELASNHPNTAWEAAQKLYELQPEDRFSLFLYSRAACAVGASWAETDALEKLILIAQQSGSPVAGYQVYLGQSYAKQGFALQAKTALQAAVDSDSLPTEQKKQVQEMIAKIQEKEPPRIP